MGYLSASEFETYGLSASTSEGMVEAASALLDAHCRRKSLEQTQYTERLRVSRNGTVRLTYLPLSSADGASAVMSAKGRYAPIASRCSALGFEVARTFGLGGSWVEIPAETIDLVPETGEITLGVGVLGLAFDEVEITYTAGMSPVSAAVKHACAMVVRNVLATPALTVRGAQVDSMHMEYFSDALIDSNVRKLLAPFVAQRVG